MLWNVSFLLKVSTIFIWQLSNINHFKQIFTLKDDVIKGPYHVWKFFDMFLSQWPTKSKKDFINVVFTRKLRFLRSSAKPQVQLGWVGLILSQTPSDRPVRINSISKIFWYCMKYLKMCKMLIWGVYSQYYSAKG